MKTYIVVLDSLGIGELPDAEKYGDRGSNTLKSITVSEKFSADTLASLGLFNIDGIDFGAPAEAPKGAYCRLAELSNAKDTVCGHWEMCGIISEKPLPTFPEGFPKEIIDKFSALTGRKILCNLPYSGTQVINDYGDEHEKTGALIVYTSADSVFQIAANEEVVPIKQLYEYCEAAREMLCGEYAVGRVIARPYRIIDGKRVRTHNRHDYALKPPQTTLLDILKSNGKDVISIGKISDIFSGSGITESIKTAGNDDGMEKLISVARRAWDGLCFVNLVDFDAVYGHRNDTDGYAEAISRFDSQLKTFLSYLGEDDVVFLTSDHGCDPATDSTDHSREYAFLIMYGKNIKPINYGTRNTFADIGKTVARLLNVDNSLVGQSLL